MDGNLQPCALVSSLLRASCVPRPTAGTNLVYDAIRSGAMDMVEDDWRQSARPSAVWPFMGQGGT